MRQFLNTWHPDARRTLLVALGLAALTAAVFAPAFRCGWVNYDDHDYVTENPQVHSGLSAANAGWAFSTFHQANWHPLTWLSLQLDASLWGLNASGYHLTNVLIHALNAALLFVALRALTGAFWRSAAVALLFAIHPLRVESVAWVSERKDVLSASFGLLALWAYAGYVQRRSAVRYAAVAVALAASLMSKPMFVTLPFLMLVLDWWPLKRAGLQGSARADDSRADVPHLLTNKAIQAGAAKARKNASRSNVAVAEVAGTRSAPALSASNRVIPGLARAWQALVVEKLPLFGLVAGSSVVTFLAQSAGGAVGNLQKFPLSTRLENAAVSYVGYLSKTVWPAHLSPFYPHLGEDLSIWQAGGPLALLAIVTAVAFALRRRAPYLLVGWLWYLGTLLPVIGLVQVGNQGMADRYTYFPQVGLLVAVCWGFADLIGPILRVRTAAIATAAVAVTLSFLTYRQVNIWHDSVALWEHAVLATGGNVIDLLNLAGACEEQGYWKDAKKWYLDILNRTDIHKSQFEEAKALSNLGNLYSEEGQQNEALKLIEAGIKLDPKLALAHTNRGNVLYRLGRFEEAVKAHEQALHLQPELKGAAYNLGLAKAALGDEEGAAKCYEKALQLNPDFAEAHSMLGNVLVKRGKLKEGLSHLRTAVRNDPKYVDGRINLGIGLGAQVKSPEDKQKIEAAADQFEEAIRLAEEEKLPEQVARLKPSLAKALYNLGVARVGQERFEDAAECIFRAIETEPARVEYRNLRVTFVEILKKNGRSDLAQEFEERLQRLDSKPAKSP